MDEFLEGDRVHFSFGIFGIEKPGGLIGVVMYRARNYTCYVMRLPSGTNHPAFPRDMLLISRKQTIKVK